jgi:membrane-bound serine protease (ClpP class)
MRRLAPSLLIGAALLMGAAVVVAGSALAHEGHTHGPGPVEVIELEGILDQRVLDFATEAIEASEAQLVVLLINSPGIASGDPTQLVAAVSNSPVPVASWVGPQDAVAYGGAAQLLGFADFTGAAPGSSIGYVFPTVAGDVEGAAFVTTEDMAELGRVREEISESRLRPDFIDVVTPSIGQFLAALDGFEVDDQVIETVDQTTLADGSVVTVPSVEVSFVKPGLFTRFLRLSIRPDAAFFFLVAGLALVVFEFYAAGVGVTAGVAALALFLAAYGLDALPVRWWAVGYGVAGILLFTWDFQRSKFGWKSLLAFAVIMVGGLNLTAGSPQFGPRWWVILIIAVGIALFYYFAMATVVRARFGTPTIGREHLIGKPATATTDLDPDGVVTVDGAAWRATSHRAAGISRGDAVSIVAVDEITLEVIPLEAGSDSPENGTLGGPEPDIG